LKCEPGTFTDPSDTGVIDRSAYASQAVIVRLGIDFLPSGSSLDCDGLLVWVDGDSLHEAGQVYDNTPIAGRSARERMPTPCEEASVKIKPGLQAHQSVMVTFDSKVRRVLDSNLQYGMNVILVLDVDNHTGWLFCGRGPPGDRSTVVLVPGKHNVTLDDRTEVVERFVGNGKLGWLGHGG
jgi:hypothetical protein